MLNEALSTNVRHQAVIPSQTISTQKILQSFFHTVI